MNFAVFLSFVCIVYAEHLGDDIVGISTTKLTNTLKKMVKGFSNVMRTGDDNINFPIMDPYIPPTFIYDETADETAKGSLRFEVNATIVGFSNIKLRRLRVTPKDLKVTLIAEVSDIEMNGPYEVRGYLYDNFLPIYGQGYASVFLDTFGFTITLDLGLEQSFITVENLLAKRYYHSGFQVCDSQILDLPSEVTDTILYDILDDIRSRHFIQWWKKFILEIIEKNIVGKTLNELFELIDYFVKAADS